MPDRHARLCHLQMAVSGHDCPLCHWHCLGGEAAAARTVQRRRRAAATRQRARRAAGRRHACTAARLVNQHLRCCTELSGGQCSAAKRPREQQHRSTAHQDEREGRKLQGACAGLPSSAIASAPARPAPAPDRRRRHRRHCQCRRPPPVREQLSRNHHLVTAAQMSAPASSHSALSPLLPAQRPKQQHVGAMEHALQHDG